MSNVDVKCQNLNCRCKANYTLALCKNPKSRIIEIPTYWIIL